MTWTSGQFVLEYTPNSDPGKIDALQMHIRWPNWGALLILRLITKLRSEQPPHAKTGSALLDKASVWAHWAFYVVILLIVASGMGTAVFTGLIEIVLQGSGAPLPANLDDVPPLGTHEFRAAILFLMVIGHLVASLYHPYWLKDGLFSRIWFGKRS
jgi:cytochrome b561